MFQQLFSKSLIAYYYLDPGVGVRGYNTNVLLPDRNGRDVSSIGTCLVSPRRARAMAAAGIKDGHKFPFTSLIVGLYLSFTFHQFPQAQHEPA